MPPRTSSAPPPRPATCAVEDRARRSVARPVSVRVLALITTAALTLGCLPRGFDWQLVVANNTDQAFYVRAPLSTDPGETLHRVARVEAGQVGPSVGWYGQPETEIHLLD